MLGSFFYELVLLARAIHQPHATVTQWPTEPPAPSSQNPSHRPTPQHIG